MANTGVTILERPELLGARANDFIIVVDKSGATANTKKMQIGNLLGNTSAAAVVANSVTTNTFIVTHKSTPTTNTDTCTVGQFWFDNTYIYIATSNNHIKRAALSDF